MLAAVALAVRLAPVAGETRRVTFTVASVLLLTPSWYIPWFGATMLPFPLGYLIYQAVDGELVMVLYSIPLNLPVYILVMPLIGLLSWILARGLLFPRRGDS